ncbi:MAG: BrnT family toxin [Gammaproteobacteria bacterium]|nr:BrnT family toxin [Gammaproteobacteria bacterium]MDE0444990.1 BrnT family toxin [Gammaproteobacteria bacterium]
MDFEWDPDTADANIAKHGVSFFDATEVFGDVLSSTFEDPDSSVGEERYLIFGQTQRGTRMVVSFTERGDTVRLTSARLMTARSRVAYEEG